MDVHLPTPKKWTFSRIKKRTDRRKTTHFQIDRSLQGEIAKEQRPHRSREHLQPFGTAGREQLPAPHPWTQRQPGDAFVVSLCHWEGLGNWVPHDP